MSVPVPVERNNWQQLMISVEYSEQFKGRRRNCVVKTLFESNVILFIVESFLFQDVAELCFMWEHGFRYDIDTISDYIKS